MIQIRDNVFETNSSSTHSLTIAPKSVYDEWVGDGNIFYYPDGNTFVTRDEAIDSVRKTDADYVNSAWYKPLANYYWKNDIDDGIAYKHIDDVPDELVAPYLAYNGYYSYKMYDEDYEYEHFYQTYTTESGDKVVAFGYYGMD